MDTNSCKWQKRGNFYETENDECTIDEWWMSLRSVEIKK